jgi:hypothetical protein
MFNQEISCPKIFTQEWSKIANAYFFPSKNQERKAQSKNQARSQLLERAQDRDENFYTKKIEIKNLMQVLLFSVLVFDCVWSGSRKQVYYIALCQRYILVNNQITFLFVRSFLSFHHLGVLRYLIHVEKKISLLSFYFVEPFSLVGSTWVCSPRIFIGSCGRINAFGGKPFIYY